LDRDMTCPSGIVADSPPAVQLVDDFLPESGPLSATDRQSTVSQLCGATSSSRPPDQSKPGRGCWVLARSPGFGPGTATDRRSGCCCRKPTSPCSARQAGS